MAEVLTKISIQVWHHCAPTAIGSCGINVLPLEYSLWIGVVGCQVRGAEEVDFGSASC
jgi:hypothetical protein